MDASGAEDDPNISSNNEDEGNATGTNTTECDQSVSSSKDDEGYVSKAEKRKCDGSVPVAGSSKKCAVAHGASDEGMHVFHGTITDPITKTKTDFSIPCDLGDIWTVEKTWKSPTNGKVSADKTVFSGELFTQLKSKKGYNVIKEIAKGKFGQMYLSNSIKDPSKNFAIKVLKKSITYTKVKKPGSPLEIPNEVKIFSDVCHPFIVKFVEYICMKRQNCIVMEFCERGNLDDLLHARSSERHLLSEPVARRYFRNMVCAVDYLHGRGIVHRDLKLHNFVLDHKDVLKLCDFGSACFYGVIGKAVCFVKCGPSGYQPPEVVEGLPHDPYQADLWCLGLLLYMMVTGRRPNSRRKICHQVSGKSCFLTDSVKEVLCGMLAQLPSARYSMNRIKYHEWFCQDAEKAQIGSFYRLNGNHKREDGEKERELKARAGV